MDDKSDKVNIPVAKDPEGNYVHISLAKSKKNYYRCPECGDYLKVRKGLERAHHFAHTRDKKFDCELRTQSGVKRKLKEIRKTEIEKAEENKYIEVFLQESYGSHLNLFGILPPLEWDRLKNTNEVKSILKKFKIKSKGIYDDLKQEWFHPREPEVTINLEPDAPSYQIKIDPTDEKNENIIKKIETIRGEWNAPGLEEGDIFVGEPSRARRIKDDEDISQLIKNGQKVFIVVDNKTEEPSEEVTHYKLGPWKVIGFEVSNHTKDLLKKHIGIDKIDKYGFYADVIIPPYADPRAEAPIYGEPNSKALIIITPPPDTAPNFEIVSVPESERVPENIECEVPGQPRSFTVSFPKKGSRRLSIHLANRHRLIHLHSNIEDEDESINYLPNLGLTFKGEEKEKFLNPLEEPTLKVFELDTNLETFISNLNFRGPKDFPINIKAEFHESDDFPNIINKYEVGFKEVKEDLQNWIIEGCKNLSIEFETIGIIKIILREKSTKKKKSTKESIEKDTPWKKDLTKEKIKNRIRNLDKLPEKANWALVRKVYKAPKGTPHDEYAGGRGGIKKKVRHALWEVKEEKGDE